jgi:hypothetical protein
MRSVRRHFIDQESAQGQNMSYNAGVEGGDAESLECFEGGERLGCWDCVVAYQTEDGRGIKSR